MNNIKLVLTDMDGTIVLPGQHVVSNRVREVVIAVEKKGIEVTAVTGRPYEMAKGALSLLGVDDLCIFDNGATIRDASSGKLVWSRWLDVKKLKEVSEIVLPYCSIIDYSGKYDEHMPDDNELELITNPAPYVFGVFTAEAVETIKAELGKIEDIYFHVGHPFRGDETLGEVQVNHIEASKFHGVKALREITGIAKENTLAIGDGHNDMPLFENAGVKIAMGNATDELKAQADFVVGTVEQDGFAEAMERFVLKP